MASKKVGVLIKEARTAAGLTQEKLAQKVDNCTASDISKAERGEKELTSTQLRQIAKATGVTQSSLLNAPKGGTGSGKTSSSSSSSTSSTSGKKKTSSSSSSASKKTMTVTATEKKLVELYREADSDTKKSVMNLLKGVEDESSAILSNFLSEAINLFTSKKELPSKEILLK
ncbi:MAG: helix-turn-helix transcriptional regulator [Oscillospiraceae bacterium]|jgi:transcriptional regulator with XRE-family HTH domain|nr:helix-turn-helix transcriptional regulator [Oscillospiraceae bacterium]MBQ2145181.1 helix-turn-helix transcriptional regulator [Oscillospiraceae bacterium]